MKIGVVGAGVVGGYYGGKLCRHGAEVHFLLRSDYEAVKSSGQQIHGPDGNFVVYPYAHIVPETIGECDLVLVCLKTTANDRFAELVTPLVGEDTAILCLQNGLGNCEQLAKLFAPEKIIGGLCFVCLNRIAPGVVRHIAFGKIVLGEHAGPPRERTAAMAELFKAAGVPCGVAENLEEGLWEKLVWNIPFNGLGVAAVAGLGALESAGQELPDHPGPAMPTDQLLADPKWEKWVREVMHEIVAVAHAKDLKIDSDLPGKMIENTRAMGEYRASTLIDFERGQPLELESLFREPLRQARATKVPVPRLESLCVVLEKLKGYRPHS
jgi:2-dehydropantoate 2-reductase